MNESASPAEDARRAGRRAASTDYYTAPYLHAVGPDERVATRASGVTTAIYTDGMLDITSPRYVEVEVLDGTVVWVHVDGVTVLRMCRIGELEINDHRNPELAARDEIDQIQRDVNRAARTRASKDICDND